jgi:hypothetical protein
VDVPGEPDGPCDDGPQAFVFTSTLTDNVVAFTSGSAHFARLNERAGEPAAAAASVEKGADPVAALAGKGVSARLADITSYEWDRNDNWVRVRHGGEERLLFADDAAQRDRLLAALRRRLGPGWPERQRRTGRVVAAVAPLGGLAASLLAAAALLTVPLGLSPGSPMLVLAVLIAAALTVFCGYWLVSVLANPPVIITRSRPR